jgi:hypothetical protein
LYVHAVSVLLPIGAPDDESPGTMFVMLQVTDTGVPAATVTVPPVKVFAPLAPLALKSPKVTPPASVAAAPTVATEPTIMASRFLLFFDIFILGPH